VRRYCCSPSASVSSRGLYYDSRVEYVPIPYAIGDNYGPVPPWVDSLRMLELDQALIWQERPNLHRKYVDVFS
jgi:hypothetical protein